MWTLRPLHVTQPPPSGLVSPQQPQHSAQSPSSVGEAAAESAPVGPRGLWRWSRGMRRRVGRVQANPSGAKDKPPSCSQDWTPYLCAQSSPLLSSGCHKTASVKPWHQQEPALPAGPPPAVVRVGCRNSRSQAHPSLLALGEASTPTPQESGAGGRGGSSQHSRGGSNQHKNTRCHLSS